MYLRTIVRTDVHDPAVRLRSSTLPSVLAKGSWPRGQRLKPYILYGNVLGSVPLCCQNKLIKLCGQDFMLSERHIKLFGREIICPNEILSCSDKLILLCGQNILLSERDIKFFGRGIKLLLQLMLFEQDDKLC